MSNQRLSLQCVPVDVFASTNRLACDVATAQQKEDQSHKVETSYVLNGAKTAFRFLDGT